MEGGYDEKNSMAAYVVHVDVLSRLAISRQRKITASLWPSDPNKYCTSFLENYGKFLYIGYGSSIAQNYYCIPAR